MLALDTMYINGMLILLAGPAFQFGAVLDVALLICIFGFVGSVAMAVSSTWRVI